eukprot:TRINITY_DN8495_c0_g1_i1.p1 TRINITY_DN8495_c0_g1~~TRINITY_DN8495_c0_g1_i1.p1  ORF type:complete len:554 (-),score=141.34 TRINITY_DN8495_c0_g1_i1:31-1692(-)
MSKENPIRRSTTDILVLENNGPIPPPTNSLVTPLLTDMYQITMAYSYWKNQKHEEPAVFDLFFRSNPFGGEFTIFAGLEEVVRHVANFHISPEEIKFLQETLNIDDPPFYEWLSKLDCSQVKIYAIPEGTIVFPRIPLITVEGPIAIAQLLETTLLTLVNFPSLMVTNAARHRLAAKGKTLLEFGLRRAQGVDGAISATRYSYMGGFNGTSNVKGAMLFGMPCKGTQAHAYISSFMDENDLKVRVLKGADGKDYDFFSIVKECKEELKIKDTNAGELVGFSAYALSFPKAFLALTDTYDTLKSGVLNFVIVAYALHKCGYKAIGIRLDSGDLSYLSIESRKIFRKYAEQIGVEYFSDFDIVASNDLNEATLISLHQQGHEINTFAIGTNLVTCQNQPALGCVYKLVEIKGHPRIKISQEVSKVTLPGKKTAYRLYGAQSYPIVDMLITEKGDIPEAGKKILCLHPFDQKKRAYVTPTKVEKLHQLIWDCGKVVTSLPSLEELRKKVMNTLNEMRTDHIRLHNPTPYKVSVSQDLFNLVHNLWLDEVPIQELSI